MPIRITTNPQHRHWWSFRYIGWVDERFASTGWTLRGTLWALRREQRRMARLDEHPLNSGTTLWAGPSQPADPPALKVVGGDDE